jgi:Zn-dependent protease
VDPNEHQSDDLTPPPPQPPITPITRPTSVTSPSGPPRPPGLGDKIKKTLGPIGVAIVALLAKFKFALLAALKFGLPLLKTGGTMLLSIGVYALLWGVWFAVGFVLLLFVHECGHLLAAKRFGLKVSAPMFIPFVGALILLKEAPRNAWVESVVGIGGPLLGSLGAVICEGLYLTTGNLLFRGLAYSGFILNLFNLMPVGFLDGGRIVTAISPWLWLVGVPILVYLLITQFNFILLMVLIMCVPRVFSLFRPQTDEERRYYEVTPQQRVIMSVLYFGLIVALVLGMRWTFLTPDLVRQRRNQVVIRMPDNLHSGEFSRHRLSAQIDAPIDIRRISLAAGDPITPPALSAHAGSAGSGANQAVLPGADLGRFQIASARFAFNEHYSFGSDARGGNLPGDF